MKFLVIFLAVLIKSKLPNAKEGVISVNFRRWLSVFCARPWFRRLGEAWQFASIVLVPTLVFVGVLYALRPLAWGLPNLFIEFAILLYILRHADVKQHMERYQKFVAEDNLECAYECAKTYLCRPETPPEKNWESLQEQVIKSLLYRWFEYFFMAIFWYMLAGVGGVILAWLSIQYARQQQNGYALKFVHWLEVIPVRLLALTYGLAGNLTQALPVWREHLFNWQCRNGELLYAVASSAVKEQSPNAEASAWEKLHNYCVSIWLVVIAVASISGWLG